MILRTLSLVTIAAALAACSTTRVAVQRMAPAEVNLAGYKRVAIGGIGGTEGDKVVTELTAALFQTQRFDVLDRQHLAEVVKEQDFAISGRVSDETAVSIGQMIGSAALIVGDVQNADYEEKVTSSKRKCMKDNVEVECVDFRRTANARLAIAFKLIDTETGKILAAKNLETSTSSHRQAEGAEPPPIEAREDMIAACRRNIVSDFVKVIAPHQTTVAVELLDDDDLPELATGNNFAVLGKWNDAIAQYAAAIGKGEDNPDIDPEQLAKAHYNMGVALGYSGQYDAGVASLEKAYSLNPEPMYMGQIATVKKFKEDDAKLAEQQAAEDAK